MKHNNVVPNAHFRKDWQRFVKTWFDQPAKAVKRRQRRAAKAERLAPRPVNKLRPAVRGQTKKYNSMIRVGRGFTIEELKAAGIPKKSAAGIGIAVDHRRKNRCQEGFDVNVQRLQAYKAKLVIFPRKASKPKKGDSTPEELAKAKQVTDKQILALPSKPTQPEPRAITSAEREFNAFDVMTKERRTAKLWGIRAKRAKEYADAQAAKKGK